MTYTRPPAHDADSDLSCVAAMADYGFGPAVSELPFLQRHLSAIVEKLVQLSQRKDKFTIKAVHTILVPFGVNIKGMRKHEPLRMFMEAAFLELLRRNRVHEDGQCDAQAFLERYPAFSHLDASEKERLRWYRNYMTIAVKYIHPEQNRDYLLDLITRLAEGCGVRHVPGSGATLATRNRIEIYRTEGCVRKKPRQPRRGDPPRPPTLTQSVEGAPMAAPLKRGRSLDEGSEGSSKRARGDGRVVWRSMQSEPSILDLFGTGWEGLSDYTPSPAAVLEGPVDPPAAPTYPLRELTADELDIMLACGSFPDTADDFLLDLPPAGGCSL